MLKTTIIIIKTFIDNHYWSKQNSLSIFTFIYQSIKLNSNENYWLIHIHSFIHSSIFFRIRDLYEDEKTTKLVYFIYEKEKQTKKTLKLWMSKLDIFHAFFSPEYISNPSFTMFSPVLYLIHYDAHHTHRSGRLKTFYRD